MSQKRWFERKTVLGTIDEYGVKLPRALSGEYRESCSSVGENALEPGVSRGFGGE